MAGDLTEARRARVRSLWLKPDRQIAEILLDEGFGGERKRTAEARTRQLASMMKNVWNDRNALKKQWRTMKRATAEDAHESRGEHLAVLDSLQDLGVEMMNDPKLKGTPRAQALQAITRIVEAKGKALGVGEIDPIDPGDGEQRPPFFGIVVNVGKVSPAAMKRINEWIGNSKE